MKSGGWRVRLEAAHLGHALVRQFSAVGKAKLKPKEAHGGRSGVISQKSLKDFIDSACGFL
jgi:hypothetical protein